MVDRRGRIDGEAELVMGFLQSKITNQTVHQFIFLLLYCRGPRSKSRYRPVCGAKISCLVCKLLGDSILQRTAYLNMIQRLLAICLSHHKQCFQSGTVNSTLPEDFCLIDTVTGNLVYDARDQTFVALSYVWGVDCLSRDWDDVGESVTLREAVKRPQERQRLPKSLPLTIQDAITVTQGIGQRYLWVDLFCISQANLKSKLDAIGKMDAVFSRAFVTVCVLQSQSMFAGIPGVSQKHQGRTQIITETQTMRYMATSLSHVGDLISSSDWSRRAWTFQEGVLATRRLCFDSCGVFLLCKEEILHNIVEPFQSRDRAICPFQHNWY